LILTIASNFALLAQKATPGFIVTLEKDTIRGFIREGTDAELTSGITFKKMTDSEEVEYLPPSILSFGFDYGRTFKQFFIPGKADGGDSIAVFAKRTLEGKINLYTVSKKKQNEPDIFLVNNQTDRTIYLMEPQKVTATDENGKTWSGKSFQHMGALTVIKNDSQGYTANPKKITYSEKEIGKDIRKYNEQFRNGFPVAAYDPQIDYRYDISAGVAVLSPNEGHALRVAAYRLTYHPEKSRTISYIRGITYRYETSGSTVDPSVEDSNQNFRQQFISLIPIGFNFQSDSKNVKPYMYFGVGLTCMIATNHHIVDYEDKGNVNDITIFPILNVGAGLKIRVGSNFIIAEVTPTGNKSGTCINLGYSF
jgi:hypothetical protein